MAQLSNKMSFYLPSVFYLKLFLKFLNPLSQGFLSFQQLSSLFKKLSSGIAANLIMYILCTYMHEMIGVIVVYIEKSFSLNEPQQYNV